MAARATCDTPGKYCCSEAEIKGQLPSLSGKSMPSHMGRVEPFAPAWPSCRAIFASLFACTKSTMRRHACVCASLYMPGQAGVMRASADTHVISANTRPAPPMARAPRCIKW
ncbi:hypothetical protein D3C72_1611020 [compost metagenome]